MKYSQIATILSLLLVLSFKANPAVAQDQNGLFLSKNADFSTEDRSLDPGDVLYVKVVAPFVDFSDLSHNEFRLKPDEGGNDLEHPLTNNLDGTYTASVDLSQTDMREDDWEVRIRVTDDDGRELRTRVDITIGDDGGNDDFEDDEVEFTGRVHSLQENGITVDGLFFIVNESTEVLDDNNQPIQLNDLFAGQIVEIRGDRQQDGTLLATKIKVEDNFPDDDGDEVEFTGIIDSFSMDRITVTGVAFVVDDNTEVLDDNAQPISIDDLFTGQIVQIRGDRQGDGSLLATRIKVEDDARGIDEVEFTGNVDALDAQSITVNGILFTIDSNTVVFDNDNNVIGFEALVVGQRVEIKGYRQSDSSLLAVRIKFEDREDDEIELTGEIERIDGNEVVVAGLTFFVGDDTNILDDNNQRISLMDLTVGLIVEIRADVQIDGSLLATDIKIEDSLEEEVEVRGLVDSVSEISLEVLGRTFFVVANTEIVDNNDLPLALGAITSGTIVEIKANILPGNTLIALRIQVEEDDPSRVRVQGPVDAVSLELLTIAGIDLVLDGATTVEDREGNAGDLTDLAVGQTVDVEALAQDAGIPLATHIRIKKIVSMKGAITSLQDNSLVLAGATIALDVNTLVLGDKNEKLPLSVLSEGQFVEIFAEIESAALKATKVELLNGNATATSIEELQDVPGPFALNQNYPNPFNPVTTISFEVFGSRAGRASLTIYNVLGQSVRTLMAGEITAGRYEVVWDGKNDAGQQLASGMYLYQLQINGMVQTKVMTLLK